MFCCQCVSAWNGSGIPRALPNAVRRRFAISTLLSAFVNTVAVRTSDLALRSANGSVEHTWTEYADVVARRAAGLRALGVLRGDRVAIMIGNDPQWQITDLAVLYAGAVPFSLYTNVPPDQTREHLADSGSSILVVEPRLLDLLTQRDLAGVAAVIVLDDDSHPENQYPAKVGTIPVIRQDALDSLAAPLDLKSESAQCRPDDIATLIFTSGTTGRAKQVQLSHANVQFVAEQIAAVSDMNAQDPGRVISYLPHAHIVDRLIGHYLPIITGATVTTLRDARTVFAHLPDIRPTFFTSVPRLWEALRTQLEERFGGIDRQVGVDEATELRAELGLADCRWLVTGSAPLSAGTHKFFERLGLSLHDVWGLSETVAVATINTPSANRVGTVGRALPGTELKLDYDGEVLLRGPHITTGYRDNEQANATSFTPDGWYRTGDVGHLDEGWLTLIGRKKELIITQGGENIAPTRIEGVLTDASALISQACVVGEGYPYVAALLTVDAARSQHRLSAEALTEAINDAVEHANTKLSRSERVRAFAILDEPFSVENGQLTPTLKLRRERIVQKYSTLVEGIYRTDSTTSTGTAADGTTESSPTNETPR